MIKLFKVALVSLAVIAGIGQAQAGDCDEARSVIEQIMEEQSMNGN
ncbi:MAG: hypothetical protein ACRBBN_12105 [Methyloligellaceae bacterium]